MSIEMEIPKVLWLKNHMPKELFDRCRFYDLPDALTHIATGNETRSFCSVVCKQGYVPVGVDGSVKGWQEDFLTEIGLEELCQDNFKRMGGVDGVVLFHNLCAPIGMLTSRVEWPLPDSWGAHRNAIGKSSVRHGSSGRHCCVTCKRKRIAGGSMASPSGTIALITRAPWLPPVTSTRSSPSSGSGG